jgi:hypothetical protein
MMYIGGNYYGHDEALAIRCALQLHHPHYIVLDGGRETRIRIMDPVPADRRDPRSAAAHTHHDDALTLAIASAV